MHAEVAVDIEAVRAFPASVLCEARNMTPVRGFDY